MSVKVMTWVWEHSRSKKTERLVLLAIADCASDDGANAYPSMAELMRKTGLSERGVQGCIAKLVALKELKVQRNAGPGGCNRYQVIMTTPAESAPPARAAGGQKVRGVHKVRGQKVHPPAESAPPPPQELRDPPARRAPVTVLEPSIEPSVVPPTAERVALAVVESETTTTQALIGEWISHCRKRPPAAVIGQVSKLIKNMLAEGIDPADVRRGLAAWHSKGLHPSTLPSVVNEAMNAGPSRAIGGRASVSAADGQPLPVGTGNARMTDAVRLAAHFAAIDGVPLPDVLTQGGAA